MRAARRLTAVGAAALCVLAGCGGGDGDDATRDRAYIEQVNAAMQRFERAAERLPQGFEVATLHRYSAALEEAAGSLRDIEPPASVAGLHRRLARDVAGYADAIDTAAEAPLSEDPGRIVQAQQDLVRATRKTSAEVNRTLTEIGRTLDAR